MRALVIAAGFAIAGTPLGAQPSPAVQPGQRVRISAPGIGENRRAAAVLSVSSDTLVVRVAGRPDSVAIAWSDLRSLDRSVGTRTRFWKGFLLGMTAGSALGAGIGAIAPVDANTVCYRTAADRSQRIPCNKSALRGDMIEAGLLFGGAIGEVVGSIVGWRARTDRWHRVNRSDWRARVSLTPSRDHGLGISVSF